MFENEVNLTIGAYGFSSDRTQYLQYTNPYYYTPVIFALTMPRPYTSIEQLYFPFKYLIWSCIVVMFCIGFIIIASLNFVANEKIRNFVVGPNNQTSFCNMINIYLGGGIQNLPKRNFARYILTVWMLGCIVLRTSYQGSLFRFLQEPKTRTLPKTFKDLLENNYTLLMAESANYIFKSMPGASKL